MNSIKNSFAQSFEDGLNENFNWFSNNWDKVQLLADFPVGMSSAVRK